MERVKEEVLPVLRREVMSIPTFVYLEPNYGLSWETGSFCPSNIHQLEHNLETESLTQKYILKEPEGDKFNKKNQYMVIPTEHLKLYSIFRRWVAIHWAQELNYKIFWLAGRWNLNHRKTRRGVILKFPSLNYLQILSFACVQKGPLGSSVLSNLSYPQYET